MLNLSWPAVIAMVLYGLNTVFDAIFVERFVGETALAGVSLAYPLSQLSLDFGSLIGVGVGSVLSIALGVDDHATQKKLLGNLNYLNLVFGVGLTIIGLLLVELLVRMMGGSGDKLVFGVDYFKVTLYGAIFWISGLSGNMVVRAEGKMGSAAIMMGTGLLVNLAANYIFIVILGLGVKGAVWGTNLGMLVYILLSFFMTLIQGIVVLNALSRFGSTSDLTFYGIIYRIFMFLLTPLFGLMRTFQPAIGINFGAEKYKRVISSFKVFGVAATILMAPFWAVIMISLELVLHMMLSSHDFLASDLLHFRIFMVLLPVLPIIFMSMTFYLSINNGKPASIMGIARQLFFYVPVMLALPRFFGVRWVYKGVFLIDLVICVWVLFMVTGEFRKQKRGEVNRLDTKKESA